MKVLQYLSLYYLQSMNRTDQPSGVIPININPHDFLPEQQNPNPQLHESNFEFTIKPLPRKTEFPFTSSIDFDDNYHQNRKHRLFQKYQDQSPVKNVQFELMKKANVEFKIPKIKEYYIQQQLTQLNCDLKMTQGVFRMPAMLEESVQQELPVQSIRETKAPPSQQMEMSMPIKSMRRRPTPMNIEVPAQKPSNMRHIMTGIIVVFIIMILMLVGDHLYRIYY